MQKIINGIQQIGIGVADVHKAFEWYRVNFGMDIRIFEEAGPAETMVCLTNGQLQERHVMLALNLQGGGGLESWQNTGRTPMAPKFDIQVGDLGIYAAKIKCKDIQEAYELFKANKDSAVIGQLVKDPAGEEFFFAKDPYGNLFQLISSEDWFKDEHRLTGGASGCILGVSSIAQAQKFYCDILGYDEVVYDKSGQFEDFAGLPGGKHELRRVLLRHSQPRTGAFSRLLGPSELELVQSHDRQGRKIFENRLWGDLGFIHLCFDVTDMEELKQECKKKGFPFVLDSMEVLNKSFEIGEAAGRFAYIEDPDGTWIEFVQTHKIPILKKFGWYLNLMNRNSEKPLPDWLLKTLVFNRVKD